MADFFNKAQRGLFAHVDWFLFAAALSISLLGLITMHSYGADNNYFDKQMFWIAVAVLAFFAATLIDYQFLRRTPVVTTLFIGIAITLAFVFLFGHIAKGAQSRFDLGLFAIQPADPAKLVLIIVLAKYFARRHIEIAHIRHILVSGAYALVLCGLVFFQPDFGSAIIIASIWLGMVLIAGISWKHLATLLCISLVVAGGLWHYGLRPYQKERILTFIHPLADIQGAGYNAYQATIAIGSGEVAGKGIGYGTQSKLRFLPEYETDFIFAAYAEEWGFFGVLLLFGLFAIVIIRALVLARGAGGNFESLFAAGVAVMFLAHFIVHIGMNMGLLPVTGTTVPFMSYGGSHLLTEFLALGILMGMRRHNEVMLAHAERAEFVGPV